MTSIDGPVGARDNGQRVANFNRDQKKMIALIWSIDITNGGQNGAPAISPDAGSDGKCDPLLAAAIKAFQLFWVKEGEFQKADGVVDPHGNTLRKMDALAGRGARPRTNAFREINGMFIRQTLGPEFVAAHPASVPSIIPGTVLPLLFPPVDKNTRVQEGSAKADIHEFLFEIQKDGVTFWMGAAVAKETSDFSRAYVYFHPATITGDDDRAYPKFTARWLEVQRYVNLQGTQLAAVRKQTLLVPFMTQASLSGGPGANMFAARGEETLNAVMTAIQMELGVTGKFAALKMIGVASFSSGVDHLFRFAGFLGASGIIREMMDFDSANMIVKHKNIPPISGAVAWQVTQNPPPGGWRLGWLQVSAKALSEVRSYSTSTHAQIGFLMFQSMMVFSALGL